MLCDFACYEDVLRAKCWRIWQRKILAFSHRNVLQLWSCLDILQQEERWGQHLLEWYWPAFDIPLTFALCPWNGTQKRLHISKDTNTPLGMVRPDSAEDMLLHDFCCKNVCKRSQTNHPCQWRSTLVATAFRKIFLANIPSNIKQNILLGYRIYVNGCKFSGTQDIISGNDSSIICTLLTGCVKHLRQKLISVRFTIWQFGLRYATFDQQLFVCICKLLWVRVGTKSTFCSYKTEAVFKRVLVYLSCA